MANLKTANEIEITNSKMWGGLWIKSSKTTMYGEAIWTRKDNPQSHPLTNGNIQRGIENGFSVSVVR